jgi:hypothetical protein
MALYSELPVYREVYRLTLRVHQLTQGFAREFKYTLGQDMKRDCLQLLRDVYRINRSRDRAPLLEAFLDDFELLKLEIRMCGDLRLLTVAQQAELAELTTSIAKQITGWRNTSLKARISPITVDGSTKSEQQLRLLWSSGYERDSVNRHANEAMAVAKEFARPSSSPFCW